MYLGRGKYFMYAMRQMKELLVESGYLCIGDGGSNAIFPV